MIKLQKVLQVFKPWESLIKVNEEFKTGAKIKAVGNVQEKNDYQVGEKKKQPGKSHRELMLIITDRRNKFQQTEEVT